MVRRAGARAWSRTRLSTSRTYVHHIVKSFLVSHLLTHRRRQRNTHAAKRERGTHLAAGRSKASARAQRGRRSRRRRERGTASAGTRPTWRVARVRTESESTMVAAVAAAGARQCCAACVPVHVTQHQQHARLPWRPELSAWCEVSDDSFRNLAPNSSIKILIGGKTPLQITSQTNGRGFEILPRAYLT